MKGAYMTVKASDMPRRGVLLVALVTAVLLANIFCQVQAKAENTGSQSQGVPVFLTDGTPLTGTHEVVGRIQTRAKLPVTVTLSGNAAFTNADSYYCLATFNESGYGAVMNTQIINVDGTHFVVENNSLLKTTVFRCIGN
jgi:hypothetical protein